MIAARKITRYATCCLLTAAGGMLVAGCARTTPSIAITPAAPVGEPQLANSVHKHVIELEGHIDNLSAESAQLPGRSEADYRKSMQKSFEDLSHILVILQGTGQSGEFRQQLRIIEASRSQLATGSTDLASEPPVDTGLRAVYRALSSLSMLSFGDVKTLGPTLDELHRKLDELDTIHGPIQRVVVSEAVDLTTQVVRQMSGVLADRVGMGAATQPSTRPDPSAAASAQ